MKTLTPRDALAMVSGGKAAQKAIKAARRTVDSLIKDALMHGKKSLTISMNEIRTRSVSGATLEQVKASLQADGWLVIDSTMATGFGNHEIAIKILIAKSMGDDLAG